jgi:metal-sulfur cluster biosynthetic enzyme
MDGPPNISERCAEIERVLNEIVDPCSLASGVPIGLVEMGIVDSVRVHGDNVSIRLLPTFPGCLYTAVFAGEIGRRLDGLAWPGEVEVEVMTDGRLWDEDRMSAEAQSRLRAVRAERRRQQSELTR